MKLLLYCTKAKPYLYYAQESRTLMDIDNSFEGYRITNKNVDDFLNGKIVAECDFEVKNFDYMKPEYLTHTYLDLLKKSCLTDKQMYDYLKGKNGYAIHIKNLHIFDKSKELDEFDNMWGFPLKKAPQNMMYAYKWVSAKFKVNEYILISIQPQWLCKILNGEKTIEVRKKVLKEMLK